MTIHLNNLMRSGKMTSLALAALLLSAATAQAQFGFGGLAGVGGRLDGALQRVTQAAQPRVSQSSGPTAFGNYSTPAPARVAQPGMSLGVGILAREILNSAGLGVGQGRLINQPTVSPPPVSQQRICPVPPVLPISQPVNGVAPGRVVQPKTPPPPPAVQTAMDEVQKARLLVAEAKRLFAGGDYSSATPKLEALVALASKDSNAYQFRSFVHFANGDYDAAAADAYDALLVGNTWNWETVYQLYGNADVYRQQLRKLEITSRDAPSMSTHFLLGYQYLVLGHLARGQRELQGVLTFAPEEELVTKLIAIVDQLQKQQAKAVQ